MIKLIKKLSVTAVAVVLTASIMYAAPNVGGGSQSNTDAFGCGGNSTITGLGPKQCPDGTGQIIDVVCGRVPNGTMACVQTDCP